MYRRLICLLSALLILVFPSDAQVTTSDIPRWYEMYDSLAFAKTTADSLAIIQVLYLDDGSKGLKLFDKARNLSAPRILNALRRYPKYYADIRENALAVHQQRDSIEATLVRVGELLPGFKKPEVTIAFGIMNTGGTTIGKQILLGAGMISADSETTSSELSPWHIANTIPASGQQVDIRALVAHEAVHTRQRWVWPKKPLTVGVINEGVCDFITFDLMGFEPRTANHLYGREHECAVYLAFLKDLKQPRGEVWSKWLYGGNLENSDWPADMGYFIGRRISAAYYEQAKNKRRALKVLMRPNRYRQVFRKSGYFGRCGGQEIKKK